jgi:diketogulonate reductase-like aldo/keto reductase
VEGVQAGKIRSIGVSNYGVHHLDELEAFIKETDAKEGKGKGGVLSINQVELHPWLARPDIVKWCEDRGVLLEAYCPIVRAQKNDDPLVVPLAKKYGKTVSQVLIRWSLQMVSLHLSCMRICLMLIRCCRDSFHCRNLLRLRVSRRMRMFTTSS